MGRTILSIIYSAVDHKRAFSACVFAFFILIAAVPLKSQATAISCKVALGGQPPSKPILQFLADGKIQINWHTNQFINRGLEKFAKTAQLTEALARLRLDTSADPYFVKLARAMNLDIHANEFDPLTIPLDRPYIAIANHPLNGTDGISLAAMLSQRRPDVKIVLLDLLEDVPGLSDHAIFLNVTESGPGSKKKNMDGIRQMMKHLAAGGAIVLFPAGEVSMKRKLSDDFVVDKKWQNIISTLWKKAPQAQIQPFFIHGTASQKFQIAKKMEEREVAFRKILALKNQNPASQSLISLLHLRELSENIGREIAISVGPMLGPEFLASWRDENNRIPDADLVEFLRSLTFFMGDESEDQQHLTPEELEKFLLTLKQRPI